MDRKPIHLRGVVNIPQWVVGPKGERGEPTYYIKIDDEGNLVASKEQEEVDDGEN